MCRFLRGLFRALKSESELHDRPIADFEGGRASAGRHSAPRRRREVVAEGVVLGGPWRRQAEQRKARDPRASLEAAFYSSCLYIILMSLSLVSRDRMIACD